MKREISRNMSVTRLNEVYIISCAVRFYFALRFSFFGFWVGHDPICAGSTL